MRALLNRCARFKLPAILGGLGLVGCVACCTLPLLGLVGVGAGAGAAAAFELLEPVTVILLSLAAVSGVLMWARRRSAAGCGASCATDGSCGCTTHPSASSG